MMMTMSQLRLNPNAQSPTFSYYREGANPQVDEPEWEIVPGELTPDLDDELYARLLDRTTRVLGGGRVKLFAVAEAPDPVVEEKSMVDRLYEQYSHKELKELADEYEVPKQGTKRALAEAIADAMVADELLEEVPEIVIEPEAEDQPVDDLDLLD